MPRAAKIRRAIVCALAAAVSAVCWPGASASVRFDIAPAGNNWVVQGQSLNFNVGSQVTAPAGVGIRMAVIAVVAGDGSLPPTSGTFTGGTVNFFPASPGPWNLSTPNRATWSGTTSAFPVPTLPFGATLPVGTLTLSTAGVATGTHSVRIDGVEVLDENLNPLSTTVTGPATFYVTSPDAVVHTWTGATNNAWDTSSSNWTSTQTPFWLNRNAPADIAIFSNAGNVNVATNINVHRIDFTGNTTLAGGSLNLIANGSTPASIDTASGAVATIGSSVAGSAGLTKTGPGTLVLTGNNSFTGGASTSDFGTLAINSDAALGASTNAIRFSNGALRTDASMTINRDVNIDPGKVAFFNTNGNDVTLSGRVSNNGFIKQGTGTLTLTNVANAQNGTRIDAGAIAITDDRQLGLPGAALYFAGGTLRTSAPVTLDRPILMQGNGEIGFGNHDVTLAGTIDAPAGTTLTLRGALNGTVRIAGNATGAGDTVLRTEPVNSFENRPTVFTIGNGGTGGSLPSGPIRMQMDDTDFGSGSASLIFDRSDTYSVASDISSNRTLTRIAVRGGGTLIYSGYLNLNGQVSVVNNSSLVVSGTVLSVFVGDTDPVTGPRSPGTLGGTGSVQFSAAVGNGVAGTIRGDWGSGTGTLNIGTSLNIVGGPNRATLAVQLRTDAAGDILDQSNLSASVVSINTVQGPLSVQLLNDADLNLGQTYTVELAESRSGQFLRNLGLTGSFAPADFNLLSSSGQVFGNVTPTIENNRLLLNFTVVPEPSSIFLLAGTGALLLRRRRRVVH